MSAIGACSCARIRRIQQTPGTGYAGSSVRSVMPFWLMKYATLNIGTLLSPVKAKFLRNIRKPKRMSLGASSQRCALRACAAVFLGKFDTAIFSHHLAARFFKRHAKGYVLARFAFEMILQFVAQLLLNFFSAEQGPQPNRQC